MATINGSTNNSQWTFKLEVSETATDLTNKTSTVKVQAYLGRASSQSYLGGNYSLSVNCAGQTQKQSGNISYPTYINAKSWLLLKTFTFTVSNTEHPTKISISSTMSSSDFTPSSASASGELTLTELHQAPSVSLTSIVEKNTALVSYGVSGTTFVPYLSKKEFNISATTYDNATIIKYGVHIGVKNYHNATTPVTVDFSTVDLMWGYDENQNIITRIMFSATDDTNSRGTIAWASYPVIPYVKPNLIATSSNVKRNGQVSGKVNLNLTGTFYNDKIGSKSNSISLSYKYWKKGTTEPTTYYAIPTTAYTVSGNNITISNWNVTKNGTVITDVGKDSVYIFKIKATDVFGSESNEIELTCPKGEWLRAIFKDRIDFKRITIQGSDIVESGTVGDTTYTKYYDGRMICTGRVSSGVITWASDGTVWLKRNLTLPDFPIEFIEPPHVIKSIESTTPTTRNVWISGLTKPTVSNPGNYALTTYWNATDTSCIVTYVAVGKWK